MESVRELMDQFIIGGHDIRIVGGFVRSIIMGNQPKDVDFCTPATPDDMRRIAEDNDWSIIATGEEFGTMTFVIDDECFEVTTLRKDVETDGRWAVTEYTADYMEDAARRDFTMNAMSIDITGKLYDYFGGLDDIRDNRIRFVGKAEDRIREDYLRVLRYFRFASELGMDTDMRAELQDFAHMDVREGLKTVSGERIWAEMKRIFMGKDRVRVVNAMIQCGIGATIGLGLTEDTRFLDNADDPVTVLSTLAVDADWFAKHWRLSNKEADKLAWLGRRLSFLTEDVILNALVLGAPREYVISSLTLYGGDDLIGFAEEVTIPEFPVRGQDLLDLGHKPGSNVGMLLKEMKSHWLQSSYSLSKEELLSSLVAGPLIQTRHVHNG